MFQHSSSVFVEAIVADRERELHRSVLTRMARAAQSCSDATESIARRFSRLFFRQPATCR